MKIHLKRRGKVSLNQALAYFLILYIIISSESVYVTIHPKLGTPLQGGLIVIGVSLFFAHFLLGRRKIDSRLLFIPVFSAIALMIVGLASGLSLYYATTRYGRFLAVYFMVLVMLDQGIDVLESLYKVILVLITLMLIGYCLFDILFPDAGLYIYNYRGTNFDGSMGGVAEYYVHYGIYARWNATRKLFGIVFPRCSGFTWEAGQYQIYVNFALYYILFRAKKIEIKPLIIILLNDIVTFSAMAWLLAVVLLTLWVCNKKRGWFRLVAIVIAIPVAAYAVYLIIVDKMTIGTISFDNRYSELQMIWDMLFRNTLFGRPEYERNMTNSYICYLWNTGYVGLLVLASLAYLILTDQKLFARKRENKLAFSIWMLLGFMNEPIAYANFTYLIVGVIIALTSNKQKGNQNNMIITKTQLS